MSAESDAADSAMVALQRAVARRSERSGRLIGPVHICGPRSGGWVEEWDVCWALQYAKILRGRDRTGPALDGDLR